LQEYAASLISDPNHSGALKCPCCPRLLRVEDATVALDKQRPARSGSAPKSTLAKQSSIRSKRNGLVVNSGDESDAIDRRNIDVLERWDAKVRDEMLRSMGDFRPCPHCSDHVDLSSTRNNNQGGGFVTPECLALINDEREAKAERLLKLTGAPSAMAVLLSYAIYYLYCSSSENSTSNGGQIAVALQIASALIPSLLLPILPHALGVILSVMARKGLMSPISVNCPCCFKDFDLEASSELQLGGGASSDAGAEAATQQWKLSHTRPCPGCSSPIIKDGGCNHVRCGRCRVEFCWACMRARTSCKAFQCKNGAPFGDAIGVGSLLRDQEAGLTLVERIDRAESISRRNLRSLRIVVICYAAWICITSGSVATPLWRILSQLTARLLYPAIYVIVFFVVLRALFTDAPGRNNSRPITGSGARIRQPHHAQFGFQTEEEQIAEAIARSLVEQ